MTSIEQIYGCNGDLWAEFARLYVKRQAPLTFKWVKSHQTARMVVSGATTIRDLHGNILADAFADKAAEKAQLPEGVTDEYSSAATIAHHIRRRLIAVHKCIHRYEQEHGKQDIVREQKEKRVPRPKVSQDYAEDVLRQLGHDPHFFHAKGAACFQCRTCRRTSTLKRIGGFLKTGQCIPAAPIQPTFVERAEEIIRDNGGEEVDPAKNIEQWRQAIRTAREQPAMPPAMASQPPMVGSTRIHHSYHVHHLKGLFFCSQCGFYATKAARKLAKPCGPSTSGSRAFLKNLEQGKFPKKDENFPEPYSRLPSGLIWKPS